MEIVQYKPRKDQYENGNHWDGANGPHYFALVMNGISYAKFRKPWETSPFWTYKDYPISHLNSFRLKLIY